MQDDLQSLLKHIRELEYKRDQLFIRQDDIENRLIHLSAKKKDRLELVKKIFNARGYYLSAKKRENDIESLKESKEEIKFNINKIDQEIQMYRKLNDLSSETINETNDSKINYI